MLIDATQTLDRALGLFSIDDNGDLFLGGHFNSLKVSLKVSANDVLKNHRIAQQHMEAASHDIWNIAGLVERLEWLRARSLEDEQFAQRWRRYAELDIAHIYYEFRSAMDHVANSIAHFSDKPGSLPESFDKLVKNREKYRSILGPILEILNQDFSWFFDLRGLRNAMNHMGREPLVFCGPQDGILFQVHGNGLKNLIEVPEFMHNQNVVRFEPYVAWHFSKLIVFLEEIARPIFEGIEVKLKLDGVRNYSAGYPYLTNWMRELRESVGGREI
jgi:hypothetical protein